MSATAVFEPVPGNARIQRGVSMIQESRSAPTGVSQCNISVSNLSRTKSMISRSSRTSITSRMSQWMRTSTAPFRRLTSKDSKFSSSTGSSNITNIDEIEGASDLWAHERKSTKRYPKKVPMATFEALAQHHELHRKASKEIETELVRHRQQLDNERRLADEKRMALEKANGEIESMRQALGSVLGQLAEIRQEAESSKQVAKEAEQRAADDRGAAELVYNMYVTLSLEHQCILTELENQRPSKPRKYKKQREMPTLEEEEGKEECFQECAEIEERNDSDVSSGIEDGPECAFSTTDSFVLSDFGSGYAEREKLTMTARATAGAVY